MLMCLLILSIKRIHTEKPVEGTPSTDSDLFMYHRGDNDAANPLFYSKGIWIVALSLSYSSLPFPDVVTTSSYANAMISSFMRS